MAAQLPARLVIELTEQDAIQDIAHIRTQLRPWLAEGALVAVDDAGSGLHVARVRRRDPARTS